jgi:hypothetical protein
MFKEHLGMFFLVVSSFEKDRGDEFIAGLPGCAGVVGITVPGLGFSGEGSEEVFLGFTSFEVHKYLL